MNHRLSILISTIFLISACSKSNDETGNEGPSDPDSFKQEAVTDIRFTNLVSGYPTTIGLLYKTTPKGTYNKNNSGEYRIEFHGLGGRPMLEGTPRNAGTSSNLTVWPIKPGDTLRLFKNGAIYRDYVTEIEDNINDGIRYTLGVAHFDITPQLVEETKLKANQYTSPTGVMSTMTFKFGL